MAVYCLSEQPAAESHATGEFLHQDGYPALREKMMAAESRATGEFLHQDGYPALREKMMAAESRATGEFLHQDGYPALREKMMAAGMSASAASISFFPHTPHRYRLLDGLPEVADGRRTLKNFPVIRM